VFDGDGDLILGYIGPGVNLNYELYNLGSSLKTLSLIIKGNHPFCRHLFFAKNPIIIIGENNFSFDLVSILFSKIYSLLNLDFFKINYLANNFSSLSLSELGINQLTDIRHFDLLFLLGVEDLSIYRKKYKKSFIIYIGSHYSVDNLEMADLILPSSIFIEKNFSMINFERIFQQSKKIKTSLNDSRSVWFIFLTLFSFFKINYTKELFFKNFKIEYPFLGKNNFKLPEYFIFNSTNNSFKYNLITRNSDCFYQDSFITKSSKNLKACSDLNRQTNFL
jgi:hypothetical protein